MTNDVVVVSVTFYRWVGETEVKERFANLAADHSADDTSEHGQDGGLLEEEHRNKQPHVAFDHEEIQQELLQVEHSPKACINEQLWRRDLQGKMVQLNDDDDNSKNKGKQSLKKKTSEKKFPAISEQAPPVQKRSIKEATHFSRSLNA